MLKFIFKDFYGMKFILGLVCGIIIALAVTLYINYLPVSQFFHSPAIANQEPNAQNNTHTNTNEVFQILTSPDSKPTNPTLPAPAVKPVIVPPPTTTADKSAQEKASSLEEKPTMHLLKPDVTETKITENNFYLQAGQFSTLREANLLKAQLALLGYEAFVQQKGESYSVLIGPFSQAQAKEVQQELSSNQISSTIQNQN